MEKLFLVALAGFVLAIGFSLDDDEAIREENNIKKREAAIDLKSEYTKRWV